MSLNTLATFLDGGRVVLELMVALAFVRLGRTTGDRLYSAFGLAFVLLATGDALVGLGIGSSDHSVLAFVPRLLGFLVMIAAIVDKNRPSGRE